MVSLSIYRPKGKVWVLLRTLPPRPNKWRRKQRSIQTTFWQTVARTCRRSPSRTAIKSTKRQKFKTKLQDNSHWMTDTIKHKPKYAKRHWLNLSPRQIRPVISYKLNQKLTKPFIKPLKNNNQKSMNFHILSPLIMHQRWTIRIYTPISSNPIKNCLKTIKLVNLELFRPKNITKTIKANVKNSSHQWTKLI